MNNGGFAPTQMDAQNSIQRKRTGAVIAVGYREKVIKMDARSIEIMFRCFWQNYKTMFSKKKKMLSFKCGDFYIDTL